MVEPMKTVTISIVNIVDGGVCVSASDGQKVYDVIRDSVLKGERVAISFASITRMTTAFLNAAVGQLYGEFPEDVIKRSLAPPIDFESWHVQRLKIVIDRAKEYFNDEPKISKAFQSESELTDDEDI